MKINTAIKVSHSSEYYDRFFDILIYIFVYLLIYFVCYLITSAANFIDANFIYSIIYT